MQKRFRREIKCPKGFILVRFDCHYWIESGWFSPWLSDKFKTHGNEYANIVHSFSHFLEPFKLTWAESSSELFFLYAQLTVCLSECKLSHFHLLQNNGANFYQTWYKASLAKGIGIQVCSNKGLCPFKGKMIAKFRKYIGDKEKIFLSRANLIQTWHKASLGEGDSSLFNWKAKLHLKGRQ